MDRIEQQRPLPRPCSTAAGRSGGARHRGSRRAGPAISPPLPGRGSRRSGAVRRRSVVGSPARHASSTPRSAGYHPRVVARAALRPRYSPARLPAALLLRSSCRPIPRVAPCRHAPIGRAMVRRHPCRTSGYSATSGWPRHGRARGFAAAGQRHRPAPRQPRAGRALAAVAPADADRAGAGAGRIARRGACTWHVAGVRMASIFASMTPVARHRRVASVCM